MHVSASNTGLKVLHSPVAPMLPLLGTETGIAGKFLHEEEAEAVADLLPGFSIFQIFLSATNIFQ
jgi:hypothetical protein